MDKEKISEGIGLLSRLAPAKNIIFVGPRGLLSETTEDALKDAKIFYASARFPNSNQTLLKPDPSASFESFFISNISEHKTVHLANTKMLTGLIEPEALQSFWGNLKPYESCSVETTTLDKLMDLIRRYENKPDLIFDWLMIDTFNPGEVLSGGLGLLKKVKCVVVKVHLSSDVNSTLNTCAEKHVSNVLSKLNFSIRFAATSRHEKFIYLGFEKNWEKIHNEKELYYLDQTSTLKMVNRELNEKFLIADVKTVEQASEIEKLNIAIRTNESQLSKIQIQINLLNEENRQLDSQLHEVLQNSKELQDAFDASKKENEHIKDEAEKLRSANEELSSVKENYLKVESRVKDQMLLIEKLEKRLLESNRDKASLIEHLNDLRTQIPFLRSSLTHDNEKAKNFSNEISQLNNSLRSVIDQIGVLHNLNLGIAGKNRKDLLNVLREFGDEHFKLGEMIMAAEKYQAILELDSNDAWAAQGLAEAVSRMNVDVDRKWYGSKLVRRIKKSGKWDVTVRLYRKALKLNSNIGKNFNEEFYPYVEPSSSSNLDSPIFVVGCGHSGTSIMLRVLGAHRDIMPIERESALFLRSDYTLKKWFKEWDANCVNKGSRRWVEKTPPHLFQLQRFWHFRPNAKVICMYRDGRDVVCSLKKREGYVNIHDRIDRWVYDNAAALQFDEDPRLLFVKYEDFVTNPSECLVRVCDFIHEDFDEKMLNYSGDKISWYSDQDEKPKNVTNQQEHHALRNWQINQPIFDGSGKWRNLMLAAEKQAFKKSKAQELLVRLGYEVNADW